MTSYLITFGAFLAAMVAAMGLARWLTGRSMGFALRRGIVSHVTQRSSHTVPTPRLGGVGLALGFGLATAFFFGVLATLPRLLTALNGGGPVDWTAPATQLILGFNPGLVLWVGLGWGAMLAVGLADDLWDLPPLVKLAGLAVGALAATLGGGVRLEIAQPLWMPTALHTALGLGLAVVWILFFTNAFNFMDGMDGFAAGFARVAATAMFAIVFVGGLRYGVLGSLRGEAFVLPLLAMACWGFLHWNRPPAKVFMGDGGSLSTGYLLAVYALLGADGRLGLALPWTASMTILLPFVFDVVLTLVRRLSRGENVLRAHRSHLYQRLMQTGLTHAEVLRINTGLFLACAGLALLGTQIGGLAGAWGALAAGLALMIAYWRQTRKRERGMGKGE